MPGNKKRFVDIPPQAQTVITSVSFQYGVGLNIRAAKFWKAVTSQDWPEAIKILKSFGDAYPTRRKKEGSRFDGENQMKYRYIVSILCASSVLSCASAQLPEGHFIINKALSESYKNFDESLKKQRSPLVFAGGNTADNCKSYFDKIAMYELDEAINNQLVKSEYLVCDALRILSVSSKYTGNINISDIGQNVLSKLDLRSFPSSLYQASDEKSHTLASLYPEQVSSNENVAELNTQDWALTLEVVAVARINDNLANDWIVWLLDESKSGNYRNYQTFIIYDAEIQKSLKATPYP